MCRNRSSSAGFTLLEVLVAFMIAALALGVMFDGVLGGMRAAATAARTQEAVALARSRLAETLVAVSSGAITGVADQEGVDGQGYHWRVRVRLGPSVSMPQSQPAPAGGPPGGARALLFGVTVTVGWTDDGRNRQVRLDGARLVLRGVPAS